MGPNYDLAVISIFYYNFPEGPHFSEKLKVSSFVMKLCTYQDLNQSSLSTKFQTFDIFCRYDMSTADAIDLGRRAIVHAAHRDAASGNIVRSEQNSF